MTAHPASFFRERSDSGFDATDATAGPWDPRIQHGGPPSALLCRAIDAHYGDDGRRTARITIDILRPTPVGEVHVDVRPVRPGRQIELVEARLRDAEGTDLVVARAWRFVVADVGLPDSLAPDPVPADHLPDVGTRPPFFPVAHDHGYHHAIEWRFVRGAWCDPGPAFVWMRPTIDLVSDGPSSAWERVLLVADSASGASAVLDPVDYAFPNVDLTVSLTRDPVGEWIGFDTSSRFAEIGAGSTTSAIYDVHGQIGSCTQTLLLAQRGGR